MATASRLKVPALIVGGGPVGLYASALLSSYGVRHVLAEREPATSRHPRAHLPRVRVGGCSLPRDVGTLV